MAKTEQNRRDILKLAGIACAAAAMPLYVKDSAAVPPRATDLPTASLWEASELVRTKRVSPKELTAACLTRIQRMNPILNAFITVTAEQAMAVEAPREHVDAPPSVERLLLPIASRLIIETGAQEGVIGGCVGMAVGIGEKAAELLIGGQLPGRGELQLHQRDVGGIEIDGNDALR